MTVGGDPPGGTLYVVATPIGNLADVTLRAIETLRLVPLIAAEDTRISRRLLARHGVETRLTSFHARSGPARLAALLEHLRGGADLALVSDAGTPLVSDPGADLVAAWVAEGGRVVPIPGPSSVLAAVVAAGVVGPRWSFEGFLPRTGRERRERLAAIVADPRGTILFEAPSRAAATLRDLAAAGAVGRPSAVCRELTKVHEQVVRGDVADLASAIAAGSIPVRGEFVIVVGERLAGQRTGDPDTPSAERPDVDMAIDAARSEVQRLVEAGTARGEAARQVSSATGIPRRRLYDVVDRP